MRLLFTRILTYCGAFLLISCSGAYQPDNQTLGKNSSDQNTQVENTSTSSENDQPSPLENKMYDVQVAGSINNFKDVEPVEVELGSPLQALINPTQGVGCVMTDANGQAIPGLFIHKFKITAIGPTLLTPIIKEAAITNCSSFTFPSLTFPSGNHNDVIVEIIGLGYLTSSADLIAGVDPFPVMVGKTKTAVNQGQTTSITIKLFPGGQVFGWVFDGTGSNLPLPSGGVYKLVSSLDNPSNFPAEYKDVLVNVLKDANSNRSFFDVVLPVGAYSFNANLTGFTFRRSHWIFWNGVATVPILELPLRLASFVSPDSRITGVAFNAGASDGTGGFLYDLQVFLNGQLAVDEFLEVTASQLHNDDNECPITIDPNFNFISSGAVFDPNNSSDVVALQLKASQLTSSVITGFLRFGVRGDEYVPHRRCAVIAEARIFKTDSVLSTANPPYNKLEELAANFGVANLGFKGDSTKNLPADPPASFYNPDNHSFLVHSSSHKGGDNPAVLIAHEESPVKNYLAVIAIEPNGLVSSGYNGKVALSFESAHGIENYMFYPPTLSLANGFGFLKDAFESTRNGLFAQELFDSVHPLRVVAKGIGTDGKVDFTKHGFADLLFLVLKDAPVNFQFVDPNGYPTTVTDVDHLTLQLFDGTTVSTHNIPFEVRNFANNAVDWNRGSLSYWIGDDRNGAVTVTGLTIDSADPDHGTLTVQLNDDAIIDGWFPELIVHVEIYDPTAPLIDGWIEFSFTVATP